MPELLLVPRGSLLHVAGKGALLYRPGSFCAQAGALAPRRLPVPPGPWYSYPARCLQPDRFRLKLAELDGELWLGSRGTPCLTMLKAGGRVFAATEKLLCCPAPARQDAFLLRIIPGSLRKALCVTCCLPSAETPLCLGTAAAPEEIRLEPGETLMAAVDSLVAWQECPRPRSFCARLRWRDLILPRLPGSLVLTFTGPGKVWLEPTAGPEPRKRRTTRTY